MRAVHKYPLNMDEFPIIRTHQDMIPFYVGNQHDQLTLWGSVDTLKPIVYRKLQIVGTGHPAPDEVDYIGSVIMGDFVWHVYDVEESPEL